MYTSSISPCLLSAVLDFRVIEDTHHWIYQFNAIIFCGVVRSSDHDTNCSIALLGSCGGDQAHSEHDMVQSRVAVAVRSVKHGWERVSSARFHAELVDVSDCLYYKGCNILLRFHTGILCLRE